MVKGGEGGGGRGVIIPSKWGVGRRIELERSQNRPTKYDESESTYKGEEGSHKF